MLKKIFLMIAVIFIFSASATETVNAELYNGSPGSLVNALQKAAAEYKIKLWGMKTRKEYSWGSTETIIHYGSNEHNKINIHSHDNNTVSYVNLSVDLQEYENSLNGGDFLRVILRQSGASKEEAQKFGIEFMAHYSDIAKCIVNNKSVSRSKLKKTFKIDCKSQNKVIYVESNVYGNIMDFYITPYK